MNKTQISLGVLLSLVTLSPQAYSVESETVSVDSAPAQTITEEVTASNKPITQNVSVQANVTDQLTAGVHWEFFVAPHVSLGPVVYAWGEATKGQYKSNVFGFGLDARYSFHRAPTQNAWYVAQRIAYAMETFNAAGPVLQSSSVNNNYLMGMTTAGYQVFFSNDLNVRLGVGALYPILKSDVRDVRDGTGEVRKAPYAQHLADVMVFDFAVGYAF